MLRIKSCSKVLIVCGIVLYFSGTNYCTAQPVVPSNVDPASIQKYELEKQEHKKRELEKKEDEKSVKDTQPLKDYSPAVHKKISIKLNDVVFEGNTVYKDKKLRKYAEGFIGQTVTYDEIKKIYLDITNLYRDNGYLTSFAYFPEQEIENGIIKITVFEGKVGNVEVKNNKWARDYYLKNIVMGTNDLEEDKVFNVNNLRRSITEVNDTKYLKGQVALQKSAKAEKTDIVLSVDEKLPLGMDVTWDNTGRRLVGTQKATISNSIQNLTGFGDKLSVSNSFARRTYGMGLDYELPVGPWGTKFIAGYSLSSIELGEEYKKYNIEGDSQIFTTGFIQPIYKGNRLNVTGNLLWNMLESETTLKNTEIDDYCLRVIRTGVNATYDDSQGRWVGGLAMSSGISGLGAHNEGGYGAGKVNFFKFNPTLVRVQRMPMSSIAIFKSSAQFTTNPLKTAEQMQLGGAYTVRGFREGALLGDAGFNFSLELRRAVPYMPEAVKIPYWKDKSVKVGIKDKLQMATFYDQGWARGIRKGKNPDYRNFLQSLGFGFRYHINDYLTASVDVGIPLGKQRFDTQNDVRAHFALTSDIVGSLRSIFAKPEAL